MGRFSIGQHTRQEAHWAALYIDIKDTKNPSNNFSIGVQEEYDVPTHSGIFGWKKGMRREHRTYFSDQQIQQLADYLKSYDTVYAPVFAKLKEKESRHVLFGSDIVQLPSPKILSGQPAQFSKNIANEIYQESETFNKNGARIIFNTNRESAPVPPKPMGPMAYLAHLVQNYSGTVPAVRGNHTLLAALFGSSPATSVYSGESMETRINSLAAKNSAAIAKRQQDADEQYIKARKAEQEALRQDIAKRNATREDELQKLAKFGVIVPMHTNNNASPDDTTGLPSSYYHRVNDHDAEATESHISRRGKRHYAFGDDLINTILGY